MRHNWLNPGMALYRAVKTWVAAMLGFRIRFGWIRLISCALLFAMPLELLAEREQARATSVEEVGAEIATMINERNQDAYARMIDLERLGYRMAATMFGSEKERKEYVRGFLKNTNADRFVSGLFAQIKNQPEISAKFMRIVERGSERRVLVRMDLQDMGFDYLEYVIERDTRGAARIVDWFPLSTGELISTSAGALSRVLVDPEPGLLKSLFGLQSVDRATLQRMRRIAELRTNGEFKEAYLELDKLPPEIATSRIVLTQRAALASAIGDNEAYRSMLEQLAQRYADQPQTAFMLIDHYVFKEDFARCLDAIGSVEQRVGKDGMTYLLRANIHMLANRLDDAERSAREGVRLEPDFADVYFTLAHVLVAQEQFDDAVEVFEALQSEFGYEFSREALEAQPTYVKFIASPAFKQWQQ